MGTSRRRASSNASTPHGHHWTGFAACCSKYGLSLDANLEELRSANAVTAFPAGMGNQWQSEAPQRTDTVVVVSLVLLVLAVIGCVLILCGGKLLPLVAALTGALLGWMLGGLVQAAVLPDWPPLVGAGLSALAGAALGALFVRVAVALGFAAAGAVLFTLLAGLLVERGIAPTQLPMQADSVVAVGSQTDATQSIRVARRGLSGAVLEIVGDAHGQSRAEGAMPALAGAGSRLVVLVRERLEGVPAPTRTFLIAATAAGAAIGLGVGLLFARAANAAAAAILGAMLLLGCGMPLLESWLPALRAPAHPLGWIFLGAALAVAGWAFQMRPSPLPKVQRQDPHPTT